MKGTDGLFRSSKMFEKTFIKCFFGIRGKFWKNSESKKCFSPRPGVSGGSLLLKLVSAAVVCSLVILEWWWSFEAYRSLWLLGESVTLLPWVKFGVRTIMATNRDSPACY